MERLVAERFNDSGLPSVPRSGDPLVFWVRNFDTRGDIYTLSLPGGAAQPYIRTPFMEELPQVSPDWRYVVYTSDESGRVEVYLSSFPSAAGKWQISTSGGTNPRWDPRGGRIHYIEGSNVIEVNVEVRAEMRLGAPRTLFSLGWLSSLNPITARFAVTPDGALFLFARLIVEAGEQPTAVLVRNWTSQFAHAE